MDLNQIREQMIYSGYISEDKIIELVKKYPNDTDLGIQVRKLYYQMKDGLSLNNTCDDDEINCCQKMEQIERILTEAGAYGLRNEVDTLAKKIIKETMDGPIIPDGQFDRNKILAYQIAFKQITRNR